MSRKVYHQFTDEFKQQIVDLHNDGMKRSEVIKECESRSFTLDKQVKQTRTTILFKTVDNLTDEQRELLALRKGTKELKS